MNNITTEQTAVKMPPVIPMIIQGVELSLSRMTTQDGVELIDLTMTGDELITINPQGQPLNAVRPILHYYITVDGVRKLRETLGEILGKTNGIILPGDLT
jgi:hypothetical protein